MLIHCETCISSPAMFGTQIRYSFSLGRWMPKQRLPRKRLQWKPSACTLLALRKGCHGMLTGWWIQYDSMVCQYVQGFDGFSRFLSWKTTPLVKKCDASEREGDKVGGQWSRLQSCSSPCQVDQSVLRWLPGNFKY